MSGPLRIGILALGVAFASGIEGGSSPPSTSPRVAAAPDCKQDFDLHFGRWRTTVSRLTEPLSGKGAWVEYEGTSVVHPLLGGCANLVELSVEGPAGRIEGISLRLFQPGSRRWSLHYASAASGRLSSPLFGRFENGRGEFYGDDELGGRPIRVRFVISRLTARSLRFEQSFSADGGKTWEANWLAVDERE
jgi:hypothetical protein